MSERPIIENISDGYGNHVHELREGEDDEHAEAEEDMDLMNHRSAGEERPRISLEDDETLGPAVEIHVMVEVMAYRLRRAEQPRNDLEDDKSEEEPVSKTTVGFHGRVSGAPQGHHQYSSERDEPCCTTHEDSQLPFLLIGDEPVVGPLRCQETEDMTEEHHDNAHMEEVAAIFQQTVIAQELGRESLHGALVRCYMIDDAKDEGGTGHIREELITDL